MRWPDEHQTRANDQTFVCWKAPQPGLSMPEFFEGYGTEAKCYRALYRWRWPQGFRCPTCDGRTRSRFKRGTTVYD